MQLFGGLSRHVLNSNNGGSGNNGSASQAILPATMQRGVGGTSYNKYSSSNNSS